MKRLAFYLFVLLFSFSSFAQTGASKKTSSRKTVKKTRMSSKHPAGVLQWQVDAQKAKCEAAVTKQCLLVKHEGKKTFELFYDDIQGFDYQEGYVYTIWVKQTPKTPPIPANASIYTYSLVKVVSKKSMPGFSNTTTVNSGKAAEAAIGKIKTVVVNEEKAPCSGGEERRCLLLKGEGRTTFELYYQDIKGFNFERGVRQTIQVRETGITPSGQPEYTLVRVVNRETVQVPSRDTSTMPAGWEQGRTSLDRRWFLRKMKDTDTSSYMVEDNTVWLQIVTSENRFNGNGPCNSFFGGFKSDLISTFQASAITNSKVYCVNIRLENLFFTLLQNADNFMIRDGRLILSKGDRLLLEFQAK
jgi:heat shock protein HslJ